MPVVIVSYAHHLDEEVAEENQRCGLTETEDHAVMVLEVFFVHHAVQLLVGQGALEDDHGHTCCNT